MIVNFEPTLRQHEAWQKLTDNTTTDIMYGGGARGGKLVSNDGLVLTKTGWIKGKDLKIGEIILNPNGTEQEIIAISKEMTLPKWRVYFSDGVFTDVAEGHLWKVRELGKEWEVKETYKIKKDIDNGKNLEIPLCDKSVFKHTRNINKYIVDLKQRLIVDIEIREENNIGRCITVSNPNGLYITNDFIVTHNSYIGCAWIIISLLQYEKSAWLIGRNELKRLKQTTLITFFDILTSFKIGPSFYTYNAQEGFIKFSNGSMVFLVDLSYKPSDPNYDRLGSYGITGAFIDEAQEVDYKVINMLKSRYSLLQGQNSGEKLFWKTTPKALYTCNPSKNWIYTDFYKPYKDGVLDKTKAFIPSLVTDNPYISQDYIENLKRADRTTVERLLYGNFEYDDTPNKIFKYDNIINLFKFKKKGEGYYMSGDIARLGRDKTVILIWHGYDIVYIYTEDQTNSKDLKNKILSLMHEYNIYNQNVVLDADGVGGPLVDELSCKGVVNNGKPIINNKHQKEFNYNFFNLKTQLYIEFAKNLNNDTIGVLDTEHKERIILELDNITLEDIDKDQKLRIIGKDKLKKTLGFSNDFTDAMAYRFLLDLQPQKQFFFDFI